MARIILCNKTWLNFEFTFRTCRGFLASCQAFPVILAASCCLYFRPAKLGVNEQLRMKYSYLWNCVALFLLFKKYTKEYSSGNLKYLSCIHFRLPWRWIHTTSCNAPFRSMGPIGPSTPSVGSIQTIKYRYPNLLSVVVIKNHNTERLDKYL